MIEVQGLTKSYGGITAIQNVSFHVKKGEVVGFLGPNGAGKSTTMKIITGYMAPTQGLAKVAGFDVFENPLEVKKRIGYLPETPPVYADMYVREYLRYVGQLKGVDKNQLDKNIDMALEKTNLGSVQKRMIQNLSKGFRQRVGIAQALVSDPEVLILDEPTVGLDPKQVAEIRDLIKELKGQHTIILSTHILPEVQATCERIIIINKGQIVAQDSLSHLSNLQTGRRQIILKVRQAKEQFEAKLTSIAGVRKVHASTNNQEFNIETEDQEGIIDQVAKCALDFDLGLIEVSTVKANLEDVFIKLTYDQQA